MSGLVLCHPSRDWAAPCHSSGKTWGLRSSATCDWAPCTRGVLAWHVAHAIGSCPVLRGLQQMVDILPYCVLLGHQLRMEMLSFNAECTNRCSTMECFGDHALPCKGDPSSWRFQLRHQFVQHTFVASIWLPGIAEVVQPAYSLFQRDDGHSGYKRGSWCHCISPFPSAMPMHVWTALPLHGI